MANKEAEAPQPKVYEVVDDKGKVENRLGSIRMDAAQLYEAFPPSVQNKNKRILFQIATERGLQGKIVYSKYIAYDKVPPVKVTKDLDVVIRQDVYPYDPTPPNAGVVTVEWYVNFADPNLFYAYGSSLFAQDEIQAAEHPILGSLRELLSTEFEKEINMAPRTKTPNGTPTPCLVRGAQRHVDVDLKKGIYGNSFCRAPAEVIIEAARVISPPTVSNIIAMAALGYGDGSYSLEDLVYTLKTAYTAFYGARQESIAAVKGEAGNPPDGVGVTTPLKEVAPEATVRVVIHTGNWGTGAFGGNRVFMALVQLIAAKLAQIDQIVFHTFDAHGTRATEEALRIFPQFLPTNGEEFNETPLLKKLLKMEFCWGVSDGN